MFSGVLRLTEHVSRRDVVGLLSSLQEYPPFAITATYVVAHVRCGAVD